MKLTDATKKYTSSIDNLLSINDINGYTDKIILIIKQLNTIWDDRNILDVLTREQYDAKHIESVKQYCYEIYDSLIEKLQKNYQLLSIPDGTLILGTRSSSGHSVRISNGKYIFWMALEAYNTREQVEIFLTHELLHAIHYTLNEPLYPETREQYYTMGRALLTEGLASYMTKKILSVSTENALWADFYDKKWTKEWMMYCEKNKLKYTEIIINHFNEVVDNGSWFLSDGTNSFSSNRVGYYFGMQIIENIASKYPEKDIFSLSLNDMYEYIKNGNIS